MRIATPRVFAPLLAPSRYKGAHGGRGSGKSHFFAEALVERCILRPGTRWVCVREIQKSLEQSVKRLIEDKIEALGVGSLFRVLDDKVETPGDGIIIFQGMQNHTAETIKSLEGYDGAWWEEAQTASQRSLDMLRPTIRKPQSELWFSWNPRRATDPVDAMLRGANKIPAIVVAANWSDNPWFPKELRDEKDWDKARDPDKYAHIWLGGYERNSEARVFRNWRIGAPEEFVCDPDSRFYFGADWGFSVDPTVLVKLRLEGRTLFVHAEAYKVGCEIDDTPALFGKVPGSRKWRIRGDSARPETISYMNRHGFTVVSALKGAGSVEDGIEFLKSHEIVVHPACKHTIDELTLYSYKIDKKTDEVLPLLEDKQNHVIDAMRYGLEDARRSASEPRIRRL
jgi:phage terminase large subunit